MRVLSLLFAWSLALSGAQAATVKPVSIGQLTDLSERVFVGVVTAQRARRAGARIVTDTTFAVEHALKGDKGKTFVLTQLGGQVGGVTQHVSGYPQFAEGERVLLFVERADNGALVVAGMAQGKFTVKPDPRTGALFAERSVKDLHFVHGRNTAEVAFVGTPADGNRVSLAQVAALIDGDIRPAVFAPRVVRRATPQVSIPEGAK